MLRLLFCQRAVLALGAMAGLIGQGVAQIDVGDPGPPVEPDRILNGGRYALAGLEGRLILYFWYLPEDRSSLRLVRRMNKLLARHRRRGLSVVGITHRDAEQVESFNRRAKPDFPLVVETSNISMGSFPFHGWPRAALIGPRGRVAWKGRPASVDDALIRKHIRGARAEGPDAHLSLIMDLPPEMEGVSRALMDGRFDEALELSKKVATGSKDPDLLEVDLQVQVKVKAFLQRRLDKAGKEREKEEYYRALLIYEGLIRQAGDLPAAEKARKAVQEMKSDRAVRRELRGGRRLFEARRTLELGREEAARKILKPLLTSSWKGTAVQRKARELLGER